MSVELGLGWIVSVDTADSEVTPVWAALPNQRTGKLTLDRDSVEINTKQNAGWRDFISHIRGWSIPVEGFGDEDDTAMLFLVDSKALAASVDVQVQVKLENTDGDTYIGWAVLDSLELDAPMDGPLTYSVTFKGKGELDLTRAT